MLSGLIGINVVLALLFSHWFADFVCQTDDMAQQKSKSNKWLSIHILVYVVMLYMCLIVCSLTMGILGPAGYGTLFGFVVVNGLIHWVTDWFTSRLNSKLWAENKVHWFFVSVGFDQFLHYAALLLTWKHYFGV